MEPYDLNTITIDIDGERRECHRTPTPEQARAGLIEFTKSSYFWKASPSRQGELLQILLDRIAVYVGEGVFGVTEMGLRSPSGRRPGDPRFGKVERRRRR